MPDIKSSEWTIRYAIARATCASNVISSVLLRMIKVANFCFLAGFRDDD